MSRQIDLTQPLSDEDRQYLQDRGRLRDIQTADANANGTEPPSSLPDDSLAASTERSPSAQPASVGAQTAGPAATADTNQSADLASPATDHTADTAEGGEPESEDNYDDESAWSYKDLQGEVSEREAEDKPALNSSRVDLIAWLRQDDES